MSKFFKWLFHDRDAEQWDKEMDAAIKEAFPPKPTRPLHPRLAQLVSEGWMAPAISPSGKPLILNGITYYEYIRNAEKLTYSRNLAYEAAVTEYNEIAGHSSLLKHHLSATKELASEIFNYRNTEPQRSELAMQQLIGLSAATEKALETKHPMGFICQVAAIFFVAENEDPDINDAALQEEKTAVFLKAYEFHDFFLRMPLVPLNVLEALFELSSTLSTVQAYHQIAAQAKLMYLGSESDSTAKGLNSTSKHLLEMSLNITHSYEHLFTKLSSIWTTSEKTTNEE